MDLKTGLDIQTRLVAAYVRDTRATFTIIANETEATATDSAATKT